MSSASHKVLDECLRFSASMTPYVDGELDAGHAVDMEAHVIACDACAERIALLRAVRQSMKRTHNAARCPDALRARLQVTIAQEQQRAVIARGSTPSLVPSHTLIRLRHAVGLAAAAGVVFAMGMSRYMQARAPVGDLAVATAATAAETGMASTRASTTCSTRSSRCTRTRFSPTRWTRTSSRASTRCSACG